MTNYLINNEDFAVLNEVSDNFSTLDESISTQIRGNTTTDSTPQNNSLGYFPDGEYRYIAGSLVRVVPSQSVSPFEPKPEKSQDTDKKPE